MEWSCHLLFLRALSVGRRDREDTRNRVSIIIYSPCAGNDVEDGWTCSPEDYIGANAKEAQGIARASFISALREISPKTPFRQSTEILPCQHYVWRHPSPLMPTLLPFPSILPFSRQHNHAVTRLCEFHGYEKFIIHQPFSECLSRHTRNASTLLQIRVEKSKKFFLISFNWISTLSIIEWLHFCM